MGNEQNSNLEKIALWTGIGCMGMVVGAIFGCVLCFGGIVWIARPPEGVTASVEAPIQIDNGDEVEFVIHVTNHNADAVKIVGIDIGMEYLDGVAITSVTPSYNSYYAPQEITSSEDTQSYYFSIPIEPGETVSVTFIGKAVASGDYGGSLDICVNSDYSCLSKVIRTVVK